jgi:hypothetical protein
MAFCPRPSIVPSHVVATELQGHILAQERELDSREGAVIAWEEGLVAFARAWVGMQGT